MIYYPRAVDFQNSTFVGTWNHSRIPVYDVPSMHSLNQLVGYVKHINAGNGTVLYRGQCSLYQKVSPSIAHNPSFIDYNGNRLNTTIEAMMIDNPCLHFWGFRNTEIQGWTLYERLIIEAALQHYGAKTFCVDFVDNHWTALWFGLYKWSDTQNRYVIRDDIEPDGPHGYIQYDSTYSPKEYPAEPKIESVELDDQKIEFLHQCESHGTIDFEELLKRNKKVQYNRLHKGWEKKCRDIHVFNEYIETMEQSGHLYLFLYVADTNASCVHGLYFGEQSYTIDLRKALPSTFLRPCAQHGWIVKGKDRDFDFNTNIACVIRVSVELTKKMLGNGQLLSQENFFPNEKIDQGYRVLLERQIDSRLKSHFPKIICADMITDFG